MYKKNLDVLLLKIETNYKKFNGWLILVRVPIQNKFLLNSKKYYKNF